MSQTEYFKQLAKFKVFAIRKVFLFNGGIKNSLATIYADLRPFFEMCLVNNEFPIDYEQHFQNSENLNVKSNACKWATNHIKNTQLNCDQIIEEHHKHVKIRIIQKSKN